MEKTGEHTLESALRAETLAARPQFEELLEFTIESTLRDPNTYTVKLQEVEEGTAATDVYVRRPGAWQANPDSPIHQYFPPPRRDPSHEAVLPVESKVQNMVEAYGKALLEEAFLCLGEDADDMALQFRQAETIEEALEICNWLTRRVVDISRNAAHNTTDDALGSVEGQDQYFYHPIRLSPKCIGEFPDIKMEPTCLSYSILIASFFEKAGADYLHSGVVLTAGDEARTGQLLASEAILYAAEEGRVPLPDHLREKLYDTIEFIDNKYEIHNGFHAAIIVRMPNGDWVQFDPNLDNTNIYTKDTHSLTHQVYDHLRSQPPEEKGMEQKIITPFIITTGAYSIAINMLLDSEMDQSTRIEEIDQLLQTVSDTPEEVAFAKIFEKCFTDVLSKKDIFTESGLINAISYYCEKNNLDPAEYLAEAAYDTLIQYVFSDVRHGFIAPSIARCKTDPAYRRRRAEDLILAPSMMLLRMQSLHGNAIINKDIKLPHYAIEAGLPAYRIGACVLSDFAVYCGDELPLSFWMAYWPSAISFAEHHEAPSTAAQLALKDQISRDLDREATYLKYPRVNSIVGESNE